MHFFDTKISLKSIELATEVLQSTFVSEGKVVQKFEEALHEKLGIVRPVCVNSGTSALHLALDVAGVRAGDEVILPAQTFVATGLVVLMQGAKPIFSDINPRTGNISPESVRAKITQRTKAIIPVHWGGYPCDMKELLEIANTNNIVVIEDAAHALGATYAGKPIGSISRFTAFSFQAIKHLTTGDGGALCCLSECDYEEARKRRWFGIDRLNSKPSDLGERVFDITTLGYKYHMNDLAAAVGLGNLESFDQILAKRRQIGNAYTADLSSVPGLQLLEYESDRQSACWLLTVLVENRRGFVGMMQARNLPVSVVHQRIDRFSVFGGICPDLPGQEYFDAMQIGLPIHASMTDDDVQSVIDAVKGGW